MVEVQVAWVRMATLLDNTDLCGSSNGQGCPELLLDLSLVLTRYPEDRRDGQTYEGFFAHVNCRSKRIKRQRLALQISKKCKYMPAHGGLSSEWYWIRQGQPFTFIQSLGLGIQLAASFSLKWKEKNLIRRYPQLCL